MEGLKKMTDTITEDRLLEMELRRISLFGITRVH